MRRGPVLAIAGGALLTIVGAATLVAPSGNVGYADGNGGKASDGNPQCEGGPSVDGNENVLTYTADPGKIVTAVCIKSGANMFGDLKHSFPLGNGTYENGCYQVAGVGTATVTVTRLFEANNCQGLSHIDLIVGDVQQETPTPTSTTTPTATPTETPTGTPTGTPTATPTGTTTATPTGTVTQGTTPTTTPTGSTPLPTTPASTATAPATSTQGGQTGTTPTAVQSTVAGVVTPKAPATGSGMMDQPGMESSWFALLGIGAVVMMAGGTLAAARSRSR